MIVTEKFLRQCATLNGTGWTKKQLALLNISWPPKSGWFKSVIGINLSEENASKFLELKGKSIQKEKDAIKKEKKFSIEELVRNQQKLDL